MDTNRNNIQYRHDTNIDKNWGGINPIEESFNQGNFKIYNNEYTNEKNQDTAADYLLNQNNSNTGYNEELLVKKLVYDLRVKTNSFEDNSFHNRHNKGKVEYTSAYYSNFQSN
ncbi:hypothetical protein [Flavobacterium sp. WC2509]|uniref:hypothetical protein n=1 Tax=Flavobacterium sp. WC2509 TaxID=3461406 RepID=UPI0040449EE1